VKWGVDLQSEHERYLTEKHFQEHGHPPRLPRTLKPFYMKVNERRKDGPGDGRAGAGVGEIHRRPVSARNATTSSSNG